MIAEDKLREFFTKDNFTVSNGMKIESVTPEFASVSLPLREEHRNAAGGIHGGVIFSIADFAFGVHSNASGILTVSQSASISYLRGVKGEKLFATAKPVHLGSHTVTYAVDVYDDRGISVATVTINGFRLGENEELK